MITGAQCFQGWGPWAGREDSDDYWGLVLSGLGGHGQRGRRVVITGAWCFQGWGPWAEREESSDYWGLVLSGLGGHGQRGRKVVITGGLVL